MPRFMRRIANPHGPLQRSAAALLLVLFVADVGFHLASSFFAGGSQEVISTRIRSGSGHPASPEPHDPGCGIPGHSGTFHHHHFPAVITQSGQVVPHIGFTWIAADLPPESVYIPLVASAARAPPLS
jgi:hypothetical protein